MSSNEDKHIHIKEDELIKIDKTKVKINNEQEIDIEIFLEPIEDESLKEKQTLQPKTEENNKKKYTVNLFAKEFSKEFIKQLILFVLVVLPLTALIYHLFIRP